MKEGSILGYQSFISVSNPPSLSLSELWMFTANSTLSQKLALDSFCLTKMLIIHS